MSSSQNDASKTSCNNKEQRQDDVDNDKSHVAEALIEAKLPAYLLEAFEDLYREDGLLVLGRGLGLLPLLAAFIRFMADTKHGHQAILNERVATTTSSSPPPLVFVLGLDETERKSITHILESWGTPPSLQPTTITNESGQGKDRAALYQNGGVFLITSRILIVDLLTDIANPARISGLLIHRAETATESSTEAFITRIFKNHAGNCPNSKEKFVKAFTEDPAALMAGFAKADKILKALFLRRLILYPRFHASVADELERFQPRVEELHQELTPLMKEIQSAIAAAVQTCIRELKNSTSLIDWTGFDLTVENCVTKNFDASVSHQLQHDWHRLNPSTKQLVNDLRTLRTLFQYLIQYDCISFYKLLQNIKSMSAASRHPSMWLLTPAADLLFRKAKERVYQVTLPKPTDQQPKPIGTIRAILEENPKWKLLRQILTEMKADWDQTKSRRSGSTGGGGARVLIMVKDNRTLESLKSYLVDGKRRTMTLRWLRYLERFNEKSRAVIKTKGDVAAISEECRLLLEEEQRARQFLFGRGQDNDVEEETEHPKKRSSPEEKTRWIRKKRKVDTEMHRGDKMLQNEDLERRAVLNEALAQTEHDLEEDPYHVDVIHAHSNRDEASSSIPSSPDDEEVLSYDVSPLDEMRVVIRTYPSIDGERALLLLQDLKPQYIVLYDADPSFIRALEIHSNSLPSDHDPLRVFFLLFESSSEERVFLKAMETEKHAFERLIQHKKTMHIPVNIITSTTQEMQQAGGGAAASYAGGTLPLAIDTRTGRGKAKQSKKRTTIAVDVREFRSSLPSILHQGGMSLAPVTLTVGDFVLTPVHCIERKSISDLFGSFASGRLYAQAESMSKHYECPCLLIEFDPNKSFSLQNANEIGADIRGDSICSKMCLLTMHVPKLRLLWSRSPYETLKVFKALKTNHDDVDVAKAMEVGSNESIDALLLGEEEKDNKVNEAARDMLLRLPGINVNNARKIMMECDSIADLAEMSRQKLKEMLGPITGQKLFSFFRQKIAES